MTNILKNLLFILGLVVLVFLGYQIWFAGGGSVDTALSGQAERETQTFLTRLTQIRSIDIDDTFFDDIRFTSLIDFRQELGDEPTGRINPFAPTE